MRRALSFRQVAITSIGVSAFLVLSVSASGQVFNGRTLSLVSKHAAKERSRRAGAPSGVAQGAGEAASHPPGLDCAWSALGAGINGYVFALGAFDDGNGPALYVGGWFDAAGGVAANSVAKWNGAEWSALGAGMSGVAFPSVLAFTVYDDGNGPALYAGGSFTTAGGVSANGIAKWNGFEWSPLGSGITGGSSPYVEFLAVFDDGGGPSLYAGGVFSVAGGASANNIAKWNGSEWSPVGLGMNQKVSALSVFDDGNGPALYAGGPFLAIGDTTVNCIAKWNGSEWSALSTGFSGGSSPRVLALTVFDDGGGPALYAGGDFGVAGGVSALRIAKWNGAEWSALGAGMNSQVGALTVYDDGLGPALYAGGWFNGTADEEELYFNAKWNGDNWTPLGSGTKGEVLALSVFEDGNGPALYAGGYFQFAGGISASRIAKWSCAQSAPTPIPTISEWGLVVLILLTMTVGTIVFGFLVVFTVPASSGRSNPVECHFVLPRRTHTAIRNL